MSWSPTPKIAPPYNGTPCDFAEHKYPDSAKGWPLFGKDGMVVVCKWHEKYLCPDCTAEKNWRIGVWGVRLPLLDWSTIGSPKDQKWETTWFCEEHKVKQSTDKKWSRKKWVHNRQQFDGPGAYTVTSTDRSGNTTTEHFPKPEPGEAQRTL